MAGYGAPPPYPPAPNPYAAVPLYHPTQYGELKPGNPNKLHHQQYSSAPALMGLGMPAEPYGAQNMTYGKQYGMVSPFSVLVPSVFPPGMEPEVVAGFRTADVDGSGFIDDVELQRALSGYNQSFSLQTVHLLMYIFTNSNLRKIGPMEFSSLFYCLQSWRGIFERFDRDRSGKIDASELRDALLSMGYSIPPIVLDLLVCKYDKSGGMSRAIEYDHFIECCLTVKGLTERFKEKDISFSGSAMFTYESFLLTVLPSLTA